MDFNNLANMASSAYKKYEENQTNQPHEQPQGGNQSGGGFDLRQASSLASGFLGSSSSSTQHSNTGGFDVSKITGMASSLLGSNHSGNNDLVSSVMHMASGANGFNQGNAAEHEMESSYHSVSKGGNSLFEQGQQAMGLAAAYSAFQKFQSSGSQGGPNQLVAMAIAEAKKLFGSHASQGGQADEKQTLATAVQGALKLLGNK
ncbi:hypothetical protein GGI25_004658 [Coemansia spiralis]|uniref:Uncharacterized protein n=2 Tax=Coemansia TaxID=4863 RepID=A0A9W8G443_9FUNG|nr:hypothetical protein BX070DRAFT_219950 [Coemansia spiralis]KAJ1989614.1 hypothetical protein EDC05_004580 [Coemansia umbellata]KAJ2620577.1 hypothetical protein GGI26_004866 [Coemansia sp. RSA 1358]KAJ2673603.1 hypothetical protein GGI25_004658 [Coemansia spiralis]